MAGAKDHRGRAAEARGCSAGHSGGQRGERFERAVRESPKESEASDLCRDCEQIIHSGSSPVFAAGKILSQQITQDQRIREWMLLVS